MVDIDKAVVAKISKQSMNFEILVDCEKALDIRSGKSADMTDVLAIEKIFHDSKKGIVSSEADIKKAFGTGNIVEAAKEIIRKGEIHLKVEQRKAAIEEKRNQMNHLIGVIIIIIPFRHIRSLFKKII